LLWNRANALNIGLQQTIGDIIVFSDIDLILPTNFVEKVKKLNYTKCFYTFQCYYLPTLNFVFDLTEAKKQNIEFGYVGLCSLSKNQISLIGGFDEYYQVWGLEDDDLYSRLAENKFDRICCSIEDYPILHQFHEFQKNKSPNFWSVAALDRHYSKLGDRNFEIDFTINSLDRPALDIFLNSKWKNSIRLSFYDEHHLSFYLFYSIFFSLKSNETCYFEFTEFKARTTIIDNISNFLLGKKNVKKISKINISEVTHFIHYFIGVQRKLILDYYFQSSNEYLLLILVKR
jgi:hypothetical protein